MEYTGERFIPDNDGIEIEAEHIHRYKAISSSLKNMKVLDAGCGTGYGSLLMSQYALNVTGIDISDETIEWCNSHYEAQKNLNFIQASLDSLPFNDSEFDCIVIFEVIEHVNKEIQNSFLKEAKRVLKPNGILIISTPNKSVYTDKSGYHNPFHISEFYIDDFKSFLKQEFKNVKLYNQSLYLVSSISDEAMKERRVRVIQNSSIDTEGKYMIALCSNGENPASYIDLSSVYKYDSSFSINMSSLYASSKEGNYSQDHKQSTVLVTDEDNRFSVTFDISHLPDPSHFRFDPVENCFCICNIDEVLTDGEVKSIVPLNALKYQKRGFLFMNIDPQFEIRGEFNQATFITITGYFKVMTPVEISEIVDDIYQQMIQTIKKNNSIPPQG
ncbi:class I SAM-dependent methyltransferase [Paenibacillus sp. NPDC057934]|uniref:class I SAM-dependent methyltransferase n=1 Tax=Paenibacillus sp. NPDC057934 TaxID=3346282 RepID=UPI0036DD58C8